MKIVNDDEFQSVHDFQTLSEKVSITDLLEVRRIGIPHDTQVKMTRVWEEHERFTPDKRKDCPIPQWYGKAIRYDGYELDENLKKILRATAPDNPRQSITNEHQDGEGWKANE